jgi:hypothetical protein
MSNARAPKRKEEYTSPSDIEVICDDILEKGTLLETMSGMKFPDAKRVGCLMLLSGTSWLGSGSVR